MAHFPRKQRGILLTKSASELRNDEQSQRVDITTLWRVIAPYVAKTKKKPEKDVKERHEKFSFYLKKKPAVLLRDLSSFMSDSVDLPSLYHETADVLKTVTEANEVSLYMVDEMTNEIYLSILPDREERYRVKWKIENNTTVAAYVAKNKEYVMVEDILDDSRFPEGVGYKGSTNPKSVMCLPLITPEGDVIAVLELYRNVNEEPFTTDDLKISVMVTSWMGIAIHQNQERLALQRQQELNDYLLNLVKCYFGDTFLMEKLMVEVMKFAKQALGAERGSFFILDKESNEFVGHLFDENDTEHKGPRFRFDKEQGIAGLVARTGKSVNIRDAYKDSRFYKEIDETTGYITRSILCMPIKGAQGILGVVQLINKRNGGCFTSNDELLFQTFSLYCSLALHYAMTLMESKKSYHRNNIYLKLIHLQKGPCIHDYIKLSTEPISKVKIPALFDQFSWYINNSIELLNNGPHYCLYIMLQLIDEKEMNLDDMIKFILTARKFYRDNPYHNFEHAFSVFHCMYGIIKRNIPLFTKLEIKALLVATICHDIDHVGFTNNFLVTTGDDLAQLYPKSVLENHHYYVTGLILKDYDIFPILSKEERVMFWDEIRDAILATDLALYFGNKANMLKFLEDKSFNMQDPVHRQTFKCIMMTACDLSGQCKPFLSAKRITENVYREFYHQGDLEKEMGLCPISIMNRDKKYCIPEDQINFLNVLVVPCTEIMKAVLPNTIELYAGAMKLLNFWIEIADARGKKVWRQDDSIVQK